MTLQTKSPAVLTGNQLKLIALTTMTIDHIGAYLLPQYTILRIIGRLSLPIYAYMIAEGCRYTRNRGRYLGSMAALALLCQLVYFFAMGSLYQCILVTFSLSIVLIYAIDAARASLWLSVPVFAGVCFICLGLPELVPGFQVDYGIFGVLLPVLIYLGKDKLQALCLAAGGLVLVSIGSQIQWYSLLAIPVLALYSGKRGKAKMKYLFYIYYPAHLVILYLLGMLL